MAQTETTTLHAPRAHAEEPILAGGGEMGALMRTFDWAASPLGPISDWPPSLRTAVSIALNSQFPTIIFWGTDLIMLYNDAYLPILADKHPAALGRPARELWSEIWSIVGPVLYGVLETGEATWSYDLFLPIIHNGAVGEHYFTFSYSPIRDETGRVRGVFCPVTETTARVQQEHREQRLRAEAEAARDQVTHVLGSMSDSFVAFDPQWRITAANASAADFMHHRREDLLGKNYWEEFPPARETNLYPEFHRAMADRVPVEFESYYPPWGCWYDVRVYPTIEGGLSVFFRDITARKQAEGTLAHQAEQLSEQNEELRQIEEELRQQNEEMATAQEELRLQNENLLVARACVEHERQRYQEMFEFAPDGYVVTDVAGNVLEANRAALNLLQVPSHFLRGISLFVFVAQAEKKEFHTRLNRLLRSVGAEDWEMYLQPRSGVAFAAALRVATVLDPAGKVVRLRWLLRDITARKRAEEALRESDSRLRLALDAGAMGTFIWHVQEDRGEPDTQMLALFGQPPAGMLTLKTALATMLHLDDQGRYAEAVACAADPAGSGVLREEVRIRLPDGSQRWLAIAAQVHFAGEPRRAARMAGTAMDITARKQAEEANLRLAAIVESSDDAIVSKSLDGIVTSWNAGAERIFGYRTEEMIGQPILRLLPEDRHAEETMILERLRRGERIDHFETVRQTKDGRLLNVSVTISPLRSERGTIIGASKIARDITERKQVEAERERLFAELQRITDELQQFAHIVSHDLNEPLRTMSNYVQLLARRLKGTLDDDATEFMAFITDAAQRMQQMLTDLLAYTQAGQTPEFQAVDCEDVLAHGLSALQARITECGAVITHDPLPTVQGDATRLGQVFQNLIGNALKFCEEKPPRIHLSAVKEDRHWRFAVRDNGIGIDRKYAGKLFQVFRRLHSRSEYPGTGIGLAICKKIVEQHGGRIWVESAVGNGATFFFTLAGERGKQMPNAEFSRNEERSWFVSEASMNILLIDDDPEDACFLQELLREAGAGSSRLVHVERLSAALPRLQEERFDVVMLDFFLPDSQGLDTLHRVREHAPDVPIVVMTGLNDEAIGRQMLEAGAQAYIVKGHIKSETLLRTLRDAVARHRAR